MTTLLSIPFGTLLITYVFFINNSVVWYLPIETDMTMSMEFNLDFVNPNEEKYLGENEEVDGVKHPNSEEKSNFGKTLEKNQGNATNVTLPLLKQVI